MTPPRRPCKRPKSEEAAWIVVEVRTAVTAPRVTVVDTRPTPSACVRPFACRGELIIYHFQAEPSGGRPLEPCPTRDPNVSNASPVPRGTKGPKTEPPRGIPTPHAPLLRPSRSHKHQTRIADQTRIGVVALRTDDGVSADFSLVNEVVSPSCSSGLLSSGRGPQSREVILRAGRLRMDLRAAERSPAGSSVILSRRQAT